jgi:HD-like signal output (HDOD) protein
MRIGITVVVLLAITATWWAIMRRRAPVSTAQLVKVGAPTPVHRPHQATFNPTTVADVRDECFKLAFGVRRFDYLILGEHAEVVARVAQTLNATLQQQHYFPRRPLLLPRLLQLLQDSDSTRQQLVRLILQDPTLAGNVLQRANSVFYRTSPKRVESIDRAVAMLGTQGLRALLTTVILQPVFRVPKGHFDNFAALTWDRGHRAGLAAEALAKRSASGDPTVAQLLGLLAALSHVVLFRLTTDQYRKLSGVMPRAEVFIRVMREQGSRLSCLIAEHWELSSASITALQEQVTERSPAAMSPLGRSLYFADLCSSLALLTVQNHYREDEAHALLTQQGLEPHLLKSAWQAAVGPRVSV